jgi:hypothetical protein
MGSGLVEDRVGVLTGALPDADVGAGIFFPLVFLGMPLVLGIN